MRLIPLLIIFSAACAHRPDADICVVNAPAEHLKCYNLKHDYNPDGTLKKSAKATFKPAHSVSDMNKGVWMSNDDWSLVKIWIQEMRRSGR